MKNFDRLPGDSVIATVLKSGRTGSQDRHGDTKDMAAPYVYPNLNKLHTGVKLGTCPRCSGKTVFSPDWDGDDTCLLCGAYREDLSSVVLE